MPLYEAVFYSSDEGDGTLYENDRIQYNTSEDKDSIIKRVKGILISSNYDAVELFEITKQSVFKGLLEDDTILN